MLRRCDQPSKVPLVSDCRVEDREGFVSKLAVIGDYNPAKATHQATNTALGHVGRPLPVEWIPTDRLRPDLDSQLSEISGLFISPSSPYRDMDGVLRVIRFARARGVPLFGT